MRPGISDRRHPATDAGQTRSTSSSAQATGLHISTIPLNVRIQLGDGIYITTVHSVVRVAKERLSARMVAR
ncbi:hypothetical protein [Skermanella aerolata]|uniref:hypothetical protein n=1 Tax=Skermanella aerolata TaxID=393310 RepID=UPI003D24AED0